LAVPSDKTRGAPSKDISSVLCIMKQGWSCLKTCRSALCALTSWLPPDGKKQFTVSKSGERVRVQTKQKII
jgi:hypothetical protein